MLQVQPKGVLKHIGLEDLHKEGPWGCAPKGTYYLAARHTKVALASWYALTKTT